MRIVAEPKESFLDFIGRVAPWFRVYKMTHKLIQVLTEAYCFGGYFWINIPPRFGKTTLLQLFAAWVMSQDPNCDIGFCSNAQRLANRSSKAARDFYKDSGCDLDKSTKSKVEWQTTSGGMMWAAGPAGQVRGYGYHIGIIDDLHKNSRELKSVAKCEAFQDFLDNTWMNRAQAHTHRPIARIFVGQRLAENDVFGYLKATFESRGLSSKFKCCVLDAFKSFEQLQVPEGAYVYPDWRQEGENLEPLVLTEEYIQSNRTNIDEWDAQYQQRPRAITGTIIPTKWFRTCAPYQVPQLRLKTGGVDLAISTRDSADWTVAFPIGLGVDGRVYVFRPWRDKKESPFLRQEIPLFLRNHGVQAIGIDSTAFQTSFVQELQADPTLAGIIVLGVTSGPDRTDKQLLARSWSHFVHQGLIVLVDDGLRDENGNSWIDIFLNECKKFPRGDHDDQIDALGYAIKMIAQVAGNLNDVIASAG
jgi:predicted phage terminase large subunit-like protein